MRLGRPSESRSRALPHLALALTLALAGQARAEPAPVALELTQGRVAAAYEFYWGGFHIGSLESLTRLEPGAYTLEFDFRTRGILAWFVDGSSQVRASGSRSGDDLRPERFESVGTWNGERRALGLAFDAGGHATIVEMVPDSIEEREPVPEAAHRGPDPLSALLSASLEPDRTPSTYASFDGRRAMEDTLHCPSQAELEPSRWSAYRGSALVCEVTAQQTAGFHKQYKSPRLQRPAKVWLAPVAGGDLYLPVRAEIETDYGTLLAHLSRIGPPAAP